MHCQQRTVSPETFSRKGHGAWGIASKLRKGNRK
jgi:hypothetical protein